jgi:hypothetical protein
MPSAAWGREEDPLEGRLRAGGGVGGWCCWLWPGALGTAWAARENASAAVPGTGTGECCGELRLRAPSESVEAAERPLGRSGLPSDACWPGKGMRLVLVATVAGTAPVRRVLSGVEPETRSVAFWIRQTIPLESRVNSRNGRLCMEPGPVCKPAAAAAVAVVATATPSFCESDDSASIPAKPPTWPENPPEEERDTLEELLAAEPARPRLARRLPGANRQPAADRFARKTRSAVASSSSSSSSSALDTELSSSSHKTAFVGSDRPVAGVGSVEERTAG